MKRIYEALHPDTKNGGDRKSQAAKNKRENQNAILRSVLLRKIAPVSLADRSS